MSFEDDTLPNAKRAIQQASRDERTHPMDPARAPRPALQAAAPPSGPGAARAGDYLLGDILAEGGFGVVHRAEHATRGTAAAVKIPHAELAAHPDILARFEREIEAIRRLEHPNVVRIVDFGRLDDGCPFFAMELLAGIDLDELLQARGRLPPDEALAILEPVCSALEAAHAQAIVHRDIKPSNVFLVDEEGRRRVVLLDFGVAKLLDAAGPSLTSSRQMVGTLAYMSPEQILAQPVDARTDVYALGALLFAMLVGEPPSPAAAYPPMRELLLPGGALRPSLRAPVHPAFDAVILRAMSHDPAARQPSAAAFLAHAAWAAEQACGAAGAEVAGGRRRALGVYVEILVDAVALAAPDPELFADFEGILPTAQEHLAAAGLALAVETGNGALFVAKRSGDPTRDDDARREVLGAARSLHRRLEARGGRDPRVRVHLSVHAGEVLASAMGDLVGGDLLDLSARIPEVVPAGAFAATAVLSGLDGGAQAEGPLVQIA